MPSFGMKKGKGPAAAFKGAGAVLAVVFTSLGLISTSYAVLKDGDFDGLTRPSGSEIMSKAAAPAMPAVPMARSAGGKTAGAGAGAKGGGMFG